MVQTQVSHLNRRTTCQPVSRKPLTTKKHCVCKKSQLQKSKSDDRPGTLSDNVRQSEKTIPDKLAEAKSERKSNEALEEAEKLEKGPLKGRAEVHGSTGDYRQDLKMRKLAEYKAKKKREEEEREQFVKDMAVKRAAERAEVVKEARRLLLYRKPLCRKINRGLLVSECLRELEEQAGYQATIKEIESEADKKEDEVINAINTKWNNEEKRKEQEKLEQRRQYGMDLKKQIDNNELTNKAKAKEELECGKQDQLNMSNYFQAQKDHEAEEILKKKRRLQQFFVDAIEEKKQFELKFKRDEEYEDRAIEIYQKGQARLRKLHKEMKIKTWQRREERASIIRKIAEEEQRIVQSRRGMEVELRKKAAEEHEAAEKEKQQAKRDRDNAIRAGIRKYQTEYEAAKEKQEQEEKDFKAWEMMQRFKRDEYHKQVELEEKMREHKKRMEFANTLKAEVEEKEARLRRDRMMEEQADDIQDIIKKENKKVLDYAEEVVAESKGVRPLYPILKAIKECKLEMGMEPEKKPERLPPPKKPKRKRGIKKPCNRVVPEEKAFYFN